MEPRTYWQNAANYHTVELIFTGHKVVYKDWWDPGHDPNQTELTIAAFLAGELHETISRELGPAVLAEALDTVELLTTGGPGVGEPPD